MGIVSARLRMNLTEAVIVFLIYNDKYIDKKYAANYQKIVAALVTGTSLNPESEKVAIRAIVKFNIEPVAAIEYAIEKSRESKDNS